MECGAGSRHPEGAEAQGCLGDPLLLEHGGCFRDRALFDLAIDSKLRGCDIVKIKIGDFATGGRIRHRAMIVKQKIGRPVQFEILEPARIRAG